MASAELRDLLPVLERRREEAEATIDDIATRRAETDALSDVYPLPSDVATKWMRADDVPTFQLAPPGAAHDRFILYFHGGGYHRGSARSHQELVARLARAALSTALLPEYRLAPEHPYPMAVDDAVATYRWLVHSHAVAPARIALAGDSAGGGLAMALLLMLKRLGEPLPGCTALLSPWVDLRVDRAASRTATISDPMMSPLEIERAAAWYLGSARADAPLASPVLADLRGLPPLLVLVGGHELLLDDARRLVAAARSCGVDAELQEWDGLFHVWPLMAHLPEATRAVDALAAFVLRHAA